MMNAIRALGAPKFGWLVAVATFGLDQAFKNVALYGFGFATRAPQDAIPVLPFFNLVMVWNEGVSYGLFPAHSVTGIIVLSLFSVAVSVGLGLWLLRTRHALQALGLGLVIGGALGNVVDRVIYGAVADFFDFHALGHHWYIFNVADIGIVVGVGVLLLETFLQPRETLGRSSDSGEDSRSRRTGGMFGQKMFGQGAEGKGPQGKGPGETEGPEEYRP